MHYLLDIFYGPPGLEMKPATLRRITSSMSKIRNYHSIDLQSLKVQPLYVPIVIADIVAMKTDVALITGRENCKSCAGQDKSNFPTLLPLLFTHSEPPNVSYRYIWN